MERLKALRLAKLTVSCRLFQTFITLLEDILHSFYILKSSMSGVLALRACFGRHDSLLVQLLVGR